MQQLELTHLNVYRELASGNHFISYSGQPFSQVSTDMANRSTPTQSKAEE